MTGQDNHPDPVAPIAVDHDVVTSGTLAGPPTGADAQQQEGVADQGEDGQDGDTADLSGRWQSSHSTSAGIPVD